MHRFSVPLLKKKYSAVGGGGVIPYFSAWAKAASFIFFCLCLSSRLSSSCCSWARSKGGWGVVQQAQNPFGRCKMGKGTKKKTDWKLTADLGWEAFAFGCGVFARLSSTISLTASTQLKNIFSGCGSGGYVQCQESQVMAKYRMLFFFWSQDNRFSHWNASFLSAIEIQGAFVHPWGLEKKIRVRWCGRCENLFDSHFELELCLGHPIIHQSSHQPLFLSVQLWKKVSPLPFSVHVTRSGQKRGKILLVANRGKIFRFPIQERIVKEQSKRQNYQTPPDQPSSACCLASKRFFSSSDTWPDIQAQADAIPRLLKQQTEKKIHNTSLVRNQKKVGWF